MEDYRSFSAEDLADWDFPVGEEPCMDLPPMIGTDERRMHVRAYEMWLALLDGRDYPASSDLDPAALGEFAAYSVLLDFSADRAVPAIAFLGDALRAEGELGGDVTSVADVPSRALLSRLTEHYVEILENRAPVGFEADFISHRGQPMLYRGILMPYSSDGIAIDLIHGVVNWKESAEQALSPDILQAVTTAFAGPAQPAPEILSPQAVPAADTPDLGLLIESGREAARELPRSERRMHEACFHALSRAYDVALAGETDKAGLEAILAEAGITRNGRNPMAAVIRLLFGRDYDRRRVSQLAAVLTHARRLCLAPGMVDQWLSSVPGGIKSVIAAERGERRPALKVDRVQSARMILGSAPARLTVDLGDVDDDVVLLVARREPDGRLSIVSRPIAEKAVVDSALKRFTA